MTGSKNDALENYVASLLAGDQTAMPNAWRIRHVLSTGSPNMEAGTGITYSSAPAIAVTDAQIEAVGSQLFVNTQLDAASGITTGETIIRRVLEFSIDGGSTWAIGGYYSSDVLDADDAAITGVAMPSGTILRVPANTGFSATED